MKTVLIIGGTGVLSSAVVNEALNNQISVTILNRGRHLSQIDNRVSLIKCDFYDETKVKENLSGKKYDTIIDFLSVTLSSEIYSYNLLKGYTKQYIFISSCAVYNANIPGIKTEDSELGLNIWKYSLDKCECEKWLIEAAKNDNIKYTIVRPAVTYGDTRIPFGVMPAYRKHGSLLFRIFNNKPIVTWNHCNAKFNMLRVEDFAVGLVGLIGCEKAYNEIFNICGDSNSVASSEDVLLCLEKKLRKKILRFDITAEQYENEIKDSEGEILGGRAISCVCSNEKIKSVVPKFKHTISLYEGISKTVDAYINNSFQDGVDYVYDGTCDRIIKKYSKSNKLHFIEYLNVNYFRDKIMYLIGLYNINGRCPYMVNILISVLSRIGK